MLATLVLLLTLLPPPGVAGAADPARPFWGTLRPGPFAVGFRSRWERDPAHAWQTTLPDGTPFADGPAPRPVLVNAWYPARADGSGTPLRHGDYLDVIPDDPALAPLARALVAYERQVLRDEVCTRDEGETPDATRDAWLAALLDTPVPARRGATPAAGPFPLVLYHSGFGSSFEDDAVLCELLASHGYVVLGGAWLEGDGSSFNVDANEASFGDLTLMIRLAAARPEVDGERVAMVGHSGGAHAAFRVVGLPNSPLDAAVALDTTQGPFPLSDPRWDRFVEATLAGADDARAALLVATRPEGAFLLADRLTGCERFYRTWGGLDHNDYIAQGIQHAELLARQADATPQTKERAVRVRAGYDALCTDVLAFLDAELKGDGAAREALLAPREPLPGGEAPRITAVPAGADGPVPFDRSSGGPPTPRQLRPFLQAHGAAATAALLERFVDEDPLPTALHRDVAASLLYELVEDGRLSDARILWGALGRAWPGLPGLLVHIGSFYAGDSEHYRGFQVQCLRTALALQQDETWTAQLAELTGVNGAPEDVVAALYDAVTFGPRTTPDWDAVRALFLPEAVIVLRTSREATTVFDLDGFLGDFTTFAARDDVAAAGFSERILRQHVEALRDIARVSVLYEAAIPGSSRPPQQGVDLIQLVRREGRWQIASIVNDLPDDEHPLPPELRPGP